MNKVQVLKDVLSWAKDNNKVLYQKYSVAFNEQDIEKMKGIAREILKQRIKVDTSYQYGLPEDLLKKLGAKIKTKDQVVLSKEEKNLIKAVNGQLKYSLEF